MARSYKLDSNWYVTPWCSRTKNHFTDKQGATGTKMSVESINLASVVDVRMETSGFGFDDSELTFTYIKTAHMKAHSVEYVSHKLEFLRNMM